MMPGLLTHRQVRTPSAPLASGPPFHPDHHLWQPQVMLGLNGVSQNHVTHRKRRWGPLSFHLFCSLNSFPGPISFLLLPGRSLVGIALPWSFVALTAPVMDVVLAGTYLWCSKSLARGCK